MRCARCDRIVHPPTLALDPSDHLVFGWCSTCLAATGCTLLDGPTWPLRVRRPPLRRRLRRLALSWRRTGGLHGPAGRRLALLGLIATLQLWALVFALLGLWRWLRPIPTPPRVLVPGTPALLLAGATALSLTGLSLWPVLLPPSRRPALLRRLRHFVLGLVATLSFALALALSTGSPALPLLGCALLGFLAYWLVTPRLRRSGPHTPRPPAAPASRPRRPTRPS